MPMVKGAVSTENVQKWQSSTVIVCVVFFIFLAFFIVYIQMVEKRISLVLGDGIFNVLVVSDDASRQKGLGGKDSIADNEGLMMNFSSDSKWGIWMKDMKFPIDIVWLDSNKKVVDIVKNVKPDEPTGTVHRPRKPARYVLEFKAGTVDNKAIHINSQAAIPEG